jgi:hypothetical protein
MYEGPLSKISAAAHTPMVVGAVWAVIAPVWKDFVDAW